MRNKVVVLLIALTLLLAVATGAIARQATPSPGPGTLPKGVTADRLIEADLDWHGLPRGLNTLALARLTIPPGQETTAENGAHLFFVESGALTVQEYARAYISPMGTPGPVHTEVPAGPPVTYAAGEEFAVSYDVESPPAIANDGTEPAVALVVSLSVRSPMSPGEFLSGEAVVESLSVSGAARVGPPLLGAGEPDAAPIAASLVRASYDEGAGRGPGGELIDEAMIDVGRLVAEDGARLLVVESGALNVLVGDAAFYAPAEGSGRPLPPNTRISLLPGDQILVRAPGLIATRNVARGPSAVLIVTIGPAAASAAAPYRSAVA